MKGIVSKIKVCATVGVLGIIALILGLAARSHALKSGDAETTSADRSTCSFTPRAAAPMGVIAALCILTAQIIANAAGGCVCCCPRRRSGVLKKGAMLCLVLSWFFTCVSFLLLFIAGLLNSSLSRKTNVDAQSIYCPIPSSWPFPAGGVFALVAAVLAIVFYLLATSASESQPLPHHRSQVELPLYK